MKEIILDIKDNEKKCYIDDLPLLELIPKEQIDIVATSLAREIIEIIKAKEKRRQYYLNSKKPKTPP
ncbi:MAG TPA: hypothetical protein IAB72_01785 [Candidatus Onthoplasma faecipullorum]|nr:hypothetical protein [Candidatus Onthoplasma faecipullorum]